MRYTRHNLLLAIAVALIMTTACAGNRVRPAEEIGPLGDVHAMTWEDRERVYTLFVPSTYDVKVPHPLVLALHGGGSDGPGMERFSGFNRVGEQEGFLVVYPSGVDKGWNDGRKDPLSEAHTEDVDDVGFLKALVEKLGDEYNIDPRRVYVSGISNGGMMSHRLACEAPEVFAAAAPVTTNMSKDLLPRCSPGVGVAMLLMNGTDDPITPFDGGMVKVLGRERGEVVSTQASLEVWLEHNGCAAEPDETSTLDAKADDTTRVHVARYTTGCSHPVTLYTVEGGGHTWPGGAQYLGPWLVGAVSREIVAEEVIWSFFKRQRR